MKRTGWIGVVLYALLAQGANGQSAELAPLLTGDLEKLVFVAEPVPLPEAELQTLDGEPVALADLKGRFTILNFWATWCPPCRDEMPSLDRLQAARPDLAVIPVAAGPNPRPAIDAFWEEAAIANLTTMADPNMALAAQLGVLGLPVTVIVDAKGREVARLIGELEWDAPETLAVLDVLAAD